MHVEIFSWANPTPIDIERRLPAGQPVYIISDLHLGDGSRSDSFMGKDRELLAFLKMVQREGAHLVIAGDAIDFHQAWSFTRILKAHSELLGELARMSDTTGVTYIWGNHDYDIKLFKDILRFNVCSRLTIGDEAVVQHGYEYDPFIGPNLEQSHVITRVHHFIERAFGIWIRLPLENFYNWGNRLAFWIAVRGLTAANVVLAPLRAAGWKSAGRFLMDQADYWTQNQLGDPQCIFAAVKNQVENGPQKWLVTGHSHLPGKIEIAPGKYYINTGSWTFRSAQYAAWDGEGFVVKDWLTDREYDDRYYLPLMDDRFRHLGWEEWWRENYMGYLRFRGAEERRLRPHEWRIDVGQGRPGAEDAPEPPSELG